MNFKTKTALSAFAAALLASAALLLAGCAAEPSSESMRDVIEDFISAVNDRDSSGVRNRLDDDVVNGNQASDPAWYSTYFPATDYEISTFNKTGNNVTVEFSSAATPIVRYFEMTEEEATATKGGTFYIRRIRQTNSTGTVILQ